MATNLAHPPALEYSEPAFRGEIGVARREITPPVGIYSRHFACLKDGMKMEGAHRPLTVTAAVFKSPDRASRLALVAVDASWFKDPSDEKALIRKPVLKALELPESDLIIAYSHTHSGPSVSSSEKELAGGHLILPYLKHISDQIVEAISDADARCQAATLTWATGRCDLAVNRDQVDPDPEKRRLIVGYDPESFADDTLLVGRITSDSNGSILGTILNYACHPITLGWQNRLASPDFVGFAREVVEANTGNAPCLFLQGASGELAPRRQYVSDYSIAQSNGRQLGYAALSTLESMLMPGCALRYQSIMESGAPLGVWRQEKYSPPLIACGVCISVPLPLKHRPTPAELELKVAECKDSTLRERLLRDLRIGRFVGDNTTCDVPAWVWRLGSSFIIAHPNEAYSELQIQLRKTFPGHALAVLNVANGWCGYLPPQKLYDLNVYQVWQTPFAPGSLETLIAGTQATVRDLLSERTAIS